MTLFNLIQVELSQSTNSLNSMDEYNGPKNHVSGFRTCGVYPFNPKAVLDHDPCTVSKSLHENPPDAVDHDKTSTDSPVNPPPVFFTRGRTMISN